MLKCTAESQVIANVTVIELSAAHCKLEYLHGEVHGKFEQQLNKEERIDYLVPWYSVNIMD